MAITIQEYTKDRIPDVLAFERRLREEEDDWGWEIDEPYVRAVEASFSDSAFEGSVSLLAYEGPAVVGRIDAALIASHFDGSKRRTWTGYACSRAAGTGAWRKRCWSPCGTFCAGGISTR